MTISTKAVFWTLNDEETSIKPGDVVRYDLEGVFLWRPGDTILAHPADKRYNLIKNPGILSESQMRAIAQDTAHFIALITDMEVETIGPHSDYPTYQLKGRS